MPVEDFRDIQEKDEISSSESFAEINDFVSRLHHMDDDDKYYWAVKDAKKLLAEGISVADLKEKYTFYDNIAKEHEYIDKLLVEANVPFEKREKVRNVIRQKTSEETHGQGRQLKWEHVQKIKRTVEGLRHDQINLQYLVEKKIASGDVHFGVAQILNENLFKTAEKVFSDRFWRLTDQMHPNNFPNFTLTFNFALQESFTQGQSLKSIKDFSERIKKSVLQDAEELLSEFFTHEEKNKYLQDLKKKETNRPAKLLETILDLKAQKEKRHDKSTTTIQKIKLMVLQKNPKGALSEIENIKKKYGENIISVLREQGFFTKLQARVLEVQKLEKEIQSLKDPKKKKQALSQLQKLQGDSPALPSKEEKGVSTNEKKKEIENILKEINQFRQQGDLSSAQNAAWKLKSLDKERAEKEIQKIKALQAKAENKEETIDSGAESSEGKKKKVIFLEGCIEHAKKVMEECGRLGIPKDDPKFWGLEGVRNRVAWLQKHGQWETYKKFNMSDRNMPSKTQAGGFRFRWVDALGGELTSGRAEKGTLYLNRFKESGYALATLAGAFSMNWKGSSSPVYTPERFILLVQDQLAKVKAE